MGSKASGSRHVRLDASSVNTILALGYKYVLAGFKSPNVSEEKKFEIASKLVSRIIPDKIEVTSTGALSFAERMALVAELKALVTAGKSHDAHGRGEVIERITDGARDALDEENEA